MHCLGTCKIILRTAKATAVGLRAAVGTKHTWVQWLGDLDSDYLVSECLFFWERCCMYNLTFALGESG